MRVRYPGVLVVLGGVVLLTLVGGTAKSSASTTESCAGGRPLCVAITDTDFVSKSTPTNARYMKFAVTVRNSGTTSQLTNVTLVLTLTDVLGDGSTVPSSAVYIAAQSTSQCRQTSTNVLSCTVPNLAAGQSATFDPLVWSTSTGASVTASRMTAAAHAKETVNDRPPSDPQIDTATATNDTTYETSADRAASYAFGGSTISLNTAPSSIQSTVFPFTVPATASPFVATLEEFSPAGSFCPTCFGQIVRTSVGAGVFSQFNPIEITATTNLSLVPNGVTAATLVVLHRHDDGSVTTISHSCSGAIGTMPPASELPCRRVAFDHMAGTAITDAWDFSNGDWGFS